MKETVIKRFLLFIKEKQLIQKEDRILLASSGGSDSMVLSDLFYRTGFDFGIAHCNFQLREKDAEYDEAFVTGYAREKHIPFHVIRFETRKYAKEQHLSIQEAARQLRYDWFEEIRKQYDYTFIATAHHKNDHVETLLLNFFKGTGIHGLHGILPRQGRIIRPMLFLSKEEILAYIKAENITYTEDVSNASLKYTRNFLRHEILPQLEKRFPGIVGRLDGNIQRFTEAEQLYQQSIEAHRKRLVEERGAEAFIPVLKLKKSVPLSTLAYELLKNYNFSYEQSQQVIGLIDKEPGRVVCSATHQLLLDRKWFIISPLRSTENTHILIEEKDTRIEREDLHLTLTKKKITDFRLSANPSIAALDAAKVTFPLLLRKWKQGDYFYPLGLRKKKKLSRFFIDQKLSLVEKEKVWVLLSGHRILWVVGMRIDDRFKVTENTKQVLQIVRHSSG